MHVSVRLAAVLCLAPSLAAAHEVLHEVDRGRALAVRAWEADGEPLADREYQVFSPADPGHAAQRGRTDRNGWLSFVPDAPGSWRVRIVDPGGHGLDLALDTAAATAPAAAALPTAAFVLRPLAGVAAIVALFGALLAYHRRRRAAP